MQPNINIYNVFDATKEKTNEIKRFLLATFECCRILHYRHVTKLQQRRIRRGDLKIIIIMHFIISLIIACTYAMFMLLFFYGY